MGYGHGFPRVCFYEWVGREGSESAAHGCAWWGIDERDGNNECDARMADNNGGPCLLYDYIALAQKLYDSCFECRRPLFFFYMTPPRALCSSMCACDVAPAPSPGCGGSEGLSRPQDLAAQHARIAKLPMYARAQEGPRAGAEGRQALYTEEQVRSDEARLASDGSRPPRG
jgi:hypothetical protein